MTIDPLTTPPGPAVGNPPQEPPEVPEPVEPDPPDPDADPDVVRQETSPA